LNNLNTASRSIQRIKLLHSVSFFLSLSHRKLYLVIQICMFFLPFQIIYWDSLQIYWFQMNLSITLC